MDLKGKHALYFLTISPKSAIVYVWLCFGQKITGGARTVELSEAAATAEERLLCTKDKQVHNLDLTKTPWAAKKVQICLHEQLQQLLVFAWAWNTAVWAQAIRKSFKPH